MRKNSENAARRDRGREVSMLTARYLGELFSISEYTYYSLLLERDYPELCELFECAARSALKRYRAVGAILFRLGEYPTLNIQPRGRRIDLPIFTETDSCAIDGIISDSIEREHRGIAEYDRLMGYTRNREIANALPSVISSKRDTLSSLERTFNS